jgi:hypothetical protein
MIKMNSRDQKCILYLCPYKANQELKVQFDDFLYKLEIVPDKWDDGKNVFICLRHLHSSCKRKINLQEHWLENKQLPEQFTVGTKGVPRTYRLEKYRQLQQKKLQFLSGNGLK